MMSEQTFMADLQGLDPVPVNVLITGSHAWEDVPTTKVDFAPNQLAMIITDLGRELV